jgi:hypothetical protein
MEHRREFGMTHRRGWRALMGAAVALAATAPGGVALADDSRSSVSTELGALVLGLDPGAAPNLGGVGTSVLSRVDPDLRTVRGMAGGTLRGAPTAIVRDVGTLTACALAVPTGCAGAAAIRVAGDLAPVGLATLELGRSRTCAAGGGCSSPAAGAPPPADPPRPWTASGSAPAAQPGGAPLLQAQGADPGPVAGAQPAPPQTAPRAGGSLARTGAPILPALAGLVLLLLGGVLRCSRVRG